MTFWHIAPLVAGTVILRPLAFGVSGRPVPVRRRWLGFTAFVGLDRPPGVPTRWRATQTSVRELGARAGG
jgi:hypothetical protein